MQKTRVVAGFEVRSAAPLLVQHSRRRKQEGILSAGQIPHTHSLHSSNYTLREMKKHLSLWTFFKYAGRNGRVVVYITGSATLLFSRTHAL